MAEIKKGPSLKLSGNKDAAWWAKEIGRSRKAWKDYRDRGKAVVDRYRDERKNATESASNVKKFNILYSNTETLGPAIYSQVPVPDIRRRWQDKDPVARLAATVLQRATQFCLESYDFDAVLDACKQDYLLPGFATARVKYKPLIKRDEKKGDDGQPVLGEDGQPTYDEKLVYQEAATEYVAWDRFVMSRSRTYDKVWYVAFGDDLTKDEVAQTFGEKIAAKMSYSGREEGDEKDEHESTARVWEVWCKRGRGRFVVAEGYEGFLKEPEADPLRLENFFPNAKPIWAINTNDKLVPVPEYLEYQDQALELDDLTDRIDVLTSALRRRGVYDAEFQMLAGMLQGKGDNQFVPVDNWAAFMQKGGLEKLAFEMPLDGLVGAIVSLEERREMVKQVIYEVTGIADIVRGSSNPNETMGAQQIKARWAGLRIATRQKKFANFARDLVRMKAEIIAERFDPQTLSLMSGIQLPMQADKLAYQQAQAQRQMAAQQAQQQHAQQAQAAQQQGMQPPPAQQPQVNPEEAKFYAQPAWEEVIAILRNDKLRGFKIDIETDSTVQPDADAEKNARTELLTALGDFAQRMAPAVQSGLVPKPLAVQMIQFTLRGFKVGSQMEQELEAMEQPSGPTPEQQAKDQELQQREQAVAQAEQKAKDGQHQAQLAAKDSQAAAKDVAHKQEVFDLKERFADEVKAIQEQFASEMQRLVAEAEGTVRTIVKDMDGMRVPPESMNQGAVQ